VARRRRARRVHRSDALMRPSRRRRSSLASSLATLTKQGCFVYGVGRGRVRSIVTRNRTSSPGNVNSARTAANCSSSEPSGDVSSIPGSSSGRAATRVAGLPPRRARDRKRTPPPPG
jgi:hypothetical protein